MEKFILGISGASGINLGLRFLKALPGDLQIYVVFSQNAKQVLLKEMRQNNIQEVQKNLNLTSHITFLDSTDIGANIASGSFGADKMAIIPTSMNTLAKIACGIADCLLTRAASVMIKESRPLLLAPRELPLSSIALENMLKLSKCNTIIAPPILGYYADIKNLEQMEDFLIGKWFDCLKIQHSLYRRWQ